MSLRKGFSIYLSATILSLLAPAHVLAQGGFAEPASEADIADVYLSVAIDGENLPAGSGTPDAGKPLYDTHCAACHGFDGEGTLAQRLVGGRGSLASDAPVKTVGSYWPYATIVFDYIRRAMPYTAPMSLSNDDYYAITAYLLFLNEIIDEGKVVDRESLPRIEMPNRNGFVSAYPQVPGQYDYISR
jgi:cytochrome c